MGNNSSKWPFVIVSALICAILVTSALIYYQSKTEEIREGKNQTLSAITHYKVDQINQWRQEITGQTMFLARIGQVIRYTDWLTKNPENKEAQNYFHKTFQPLKKRNNFETIFICNKSGELLYSLDESFKEINPVTAAEIKSSVDGDSLVFGEFYFDSSKKHICIDVTTPIRDNNEKIIGTYTQIIYPEHYLYPMIQNWPMETRTGESLLAKKINGRVIFLSELRFKDNSTLTQFIPLADTEVVAVKGTMGERGVIEGKDYVGSEVLAELKHVPGTDWLLISKIDKDEIYSEIFFRAETTTIIVVISILAIIFGFLFFYKYRQSNIYKELLSKEEEFKATLYSIGDGVITTDKKGNIKQMNAVAEKLTGWKEREAYNKKLTSVFVILNESTNEKVENPIDKVLKAKTKIKLADYITLVSRNGNKIPIADSGAPIKDSDGNIIGVVLVFRDQTEEREKEKALFESNEKFSKIFHHSSESISLTQLSTGKLSEVNEGFEKVFGYSRSEVIGKTSFELGLWGNPAERDRMIDLLKQNGYIKDFEAVGNRKNGEQLTALLSGEILEFKDDQYLLLSIRDITERKKIEKTLIENEERLRLSLQAAKQGMYDINIQTDKVVVNDEYAIMLGYDPETFVEKSENWDEKLHPDDYENWEKAFRDYIAGKSDEYKIEFRLKTKDNKWKWILSSGKIVEYDNEGKPLRMLGTHTDITEKKLFEEELRSSELLFRTLAENAPVGIFKTDPAGFTTYVNPYWSNLSKLSQEEALGDGWLKVVHPEDKKLLAENWKEATQKNINSYAEYRFLLPDGSIRWVLGNAVPLKGIDGSIQGYLGTITDITERKHSEEAIKKNEAKMNSIFRAAPTGIGVVVNRVFTEVNERFCEMTGYSKEELIGKSARLIYTDETEFEYVGKEKYRQIDKYGTGSVETKWMRKDKKIIDVLLSSTPINAERLEEGVSFTALDITERKKSETALKESEFYLRKSQEVADIGSYRFEVKENKWVSSSKLDEIFGIDSNYSKTVEGWIDIIHSDDKEMMIDHLTNHVLKEHNKFDKEYRVFRKNDNSLRWVHGVGELEFDENGETVKMIGTIQDVTDRKKYEDAVQRFKFVSDYAPYAVFWMNESAGFDYVNEKACQSLGYTREELLKLDLFDIDPAYPKERWEVKWQKNLEKKVGTEVIETNHKKKNGSVFPVEVVVQNYVFGNTFLHVAFVNDITVRKRSEETLRKLSQAVEQSNVAIIITDKGGRIEYVNQKFTNVTGYSAKDVYGKNPRMLKSGEQNEEFYKDLWGTILSGKDWQGEIQNKKKNGELFWEMDIISPIFDETGNITHFVAVKEDITEKKRMLEELVAAKEHAEEMNRAKLSFFANMSHELRTPFVGILGFAELLEETLTNPEEREYATKIVQSSKRLTDTLNKILNLSRLESTGYEVYLSPVNVNEFVTEVGGLFVQYAKSNNTVLKIEAEFDDKEIETDKKLLEEILNNLLNNSVRFTRDGEIKIKTEKVVKNKEDFLRLTVSDTGIGVPKDKQAIIWQEFRQASEGFSRSFEGTGLGLTITSKYVELLGGKIALESEENKGTTFTIEIPVVYAETVKTNYKNKKEQEESLSGHQLKQQVKILFVEDDKVAGDYVKRVVKNSYKIDVIDNGDEALSLVKKNYYDILLLDINLGRGIDGLELMLSIKKMKKYFDTPVVAVTAFASESDKNEFLSKGFTHYLSKPFSPKELQNLLGEISKTL